MSDEKVLDEQRRGWRGWLLDHTDDDVSYEKIEAIAAAMTEIGVDDPPHGKSGTGKNATTDDDPALVLMCPIFHEGGGCWHYEDCTIDDESVEQARQRMIDHLYPSPHGGDQYSRESVERMVRRLRPRSKAKIEQMLERRR